MTRRAVESGFERFVDEAITATAEEFSVSRALRRGTRGPGRGVVDRLLTDSDALRRRVVQPELDGYRRRTIDQFDLLLDWVESDDDLERYRAELLDADAFAAAIRDSVSTDRQQELEDVLLGRLERLGRAVEPVVAAPETEFWPAVRATLTAEQARELVADHFAFTWPVREHRDAFELSTRFEASEVLGGLGGLLGGGLPTVEVAYTDEAIRAMRRAERQVIAEANREIDRRFE